MKRGKRLNAARVRSDARNSARSALARSAGMAARAMCEGLESRLLLSKVGPVVDAGDSYFNYTNQAQESLYRATDRVVVGFFPASTSRRARLEKALTADAGPLAGYRILKQLTDTSVILERTARGPAPSLDKLQARISGFPNLKYLSPTFFYSDWTRTAIYDQIYVDLRDDVDPAQFFAKGYASVKPAIGINAFDVTIRRGGGLDVLRVAAKLGQSPLVQVAEPNHTLTLVSSSLTFSNEDTIYQQSPDNRWNIEKTNVNNPDPNVASAWDKTTGSKDIVIAVLDNGVDLHHPDLAANIFHNEFENGNDEDHSGITGDVTGWDFMATPHDSDPDPDPTSVKHPYDNHGTVM